MDDNGGFGTGRSHPNPTRLFFSILKHVPFKKLNKTGRVDNDEKISKSASFILDFCFYFLFLIFLYFIFYFIILKLIYFIKK